MTEKEPTLEDNFTPPTTPSPTGWYSCDGKPLSEDDLLLHDRELSGASVNPDGTITSLTVNQLN